MLKWNKVIEKLDLTGNEVPDDLSRAISCAIERNHNLHLHAFHSKSHSESLAQTLQSLSEAHQTTLANLSGKLASTDQRACTLSEKLEMASGEITKTHEALMQAQIRYQNLLDDRNEMESVLIKERTTTSARITELESEMLREREVLFY